MFRLLFCINILNLFLFYFLIRHLQSCTSPIMHLICPPKFCIKFVFHFSWVLQPSQVHPRGPRTKVFQVRTKEPLGTDSHQTISKNSSGSRLLIGHQNRLPISEQFLLSSFREFVHDGYCLATLARFVFIFYFPNQKRRNYRWVEKTLGMLSAGAIQFAPRIFCFWLITIYRK